MSPMIPSLLTLILPFLVTPLVGWLSHDQLAAWMNSVIACIVIFAASLVAALLAHTLTNDLIANIMLIAAYIGAMLAGPLKPLYAYTAVSWPSPLSALISKLPAVALSAPPAKPIPALMPSGSALPPKQLWNYLNANASPTSAAPADIGELPTIHELPTVSPAAQAAPQPPVGNAG